MKVVLVVTLMLTSTAASAEEGFRSRITAEDGRGYDMRGKRWMEGEQRVEETSFSRDGAVLLTQRVAFRERDLRLDSMTLENKRTGRQETIKRKGNALQVSFRETKDAELKQQLLRPEGPVLHGTQIGALLKRSTAALERGEVVEFNLLSPQHMRDVGFRLRKVGAREIGEHACIKVRMEPRAWYVRAFVDQVHFYIRPEAPFQIVRVEGMVLSTDEQGEPVKGVMNTLSHQP